MTGVTPPGSRLQFPERTEVLRSIEFPVEPMAHSAQADYYYPNQQSSRLVWYHDHALGITRTNAYAGIASAYIIKDGFEASSTAECTRVSTA